MAKKERSSKVDRSTDLSKIRHSASHILAEAILALYPDTKLAFGPATEDGFYYDFEFAKPISEDNFGKIEKKINEILKQGRSFVHSDKSVSEATAWAEAANQPYKLEQIKELAERGDKKLSFYTSGEFTDLCAGPHVEDTSAIGVIKIMSLAGAYWKGNEKNQQLTRVYGTAFATQEDLDEYLVMMEEAKKRDHRKLGKELEIFTMDDDVGPGLPLWLPNGAAMIEELENLAKETEEAAGYVRVRTPHIAKESMYKTSGHLPYYAESMFPPMEMDNEVYYLKSMNCPHHHKIFGAIPRSYRDMPIRLAEYGTVYRYEQSGELFGLMRVRSMQMNDAHIYCTEEQFADEFRAVNEMYLRYFKIFGVDKYVMRFSTHEPAKLGEKYVDEPELWKKTEDMVKKVLVDSKIPFIEVPNEAAFYGPKIDVQVWSAIGREFTLATNQVDFAVPSRFGLEYTTATGEPATPLCIHRAPLGTHERFVGFLIEHYGGLFPTWLAPVQVRVLPIGEDQLDYANEIVRALREARVRVELDSGNDSIGKKIRNAEIYKTPYMLIIGDKEKQAGTVSVRSKSKDDMGAMEADMFVKMVRDEIQQRAG
jgi:threonyl-tRNA synthetase